MKKLKRIPTQRKFHVRSGDTVEVTSGNHRGKTGKILRVDRAKLRAYVEGVRLIKKHLKKSPKNQQGGIVEREGGIHISNLKVVEKYVHVAAKK
jgi:large subunit ribosomal protein L24